MVRPGTGTAALSNVGFPCDPDGTTGPLAECDHVCTLVFTGGGAIDWALAANETELAHTARERGATHLELDSAEARTDAHRFYEREGAAHRSISFGWDL